MAEEALKAELASVKQRAVTKIKGLQKQVEEQAERIKQLEADAASSSASAGSEEGEKFVNVKLHGGDSSPSQSDLKKREAALLEAEAGLASRLAAADRREQSLAAREAALGGAAAAWHDELLAGLRTIRDNLGG